VTASIPRATERLDEWRRLWRESGLLVLLLDFDGTLAPIVPHASEAAIDPRVKQALTRLLPRDDVRVALVSGRGLADVRERAGLGHDRVWYAGNHGMEIEGPDVTRMHEDARAARPELERVAGEVEREIAHIEGAWVEDKGLTLSIHYRQADEAREGEVADAVERSAAGSELLRVTRGKKVLEVRPKVDWHKGRAADFLLERFAPEPGTPVLYIGDDVTDEDAFRALRRWSGGTGEGVYVGDVPPERTEATSWLEGTEEVGELIEALAGEERAS
jgi:trehalose 6-phosphate phosphatase